MYICVCNALNENIVREAALEGSPDLSIVEIYQEIGVTPKCGKCLCAATEFVEKTREEAMIARSETMISPQNIMAWNRVS